MSKWIILGLLAGAVTCLGLLLLVDPSARATAEALWSGVSGWWTQTISGIDTASLWAPVASAFQGFADTVAGLWSGGAVRIEVPSIEIAP